MRYTGIYKLAEGSDYSQVAWFALISFIQSLHTGDSVTLEVTTFSVWTYQNMILNSKYLTIKSTKFICKDIHTTP